MTKKVCRKCKIVVSGNECIICKGKDFSESSKGRIAVLDVNNSVVAEKLDIKVKGEYAIKV